MGIAPQDLLDSYLKLLLILNHIAVIGRSLFTDTGYHGVVFHYSDDGDGDFENDQRDVIVDNNVFDGCAMSRDW